MKITYNSITTDLDSDGVCTIRPGLSVYRKGNECGLWFGGMDVNLPTYSSTLRIEYKGKVKYEDLVTIEFGQIFPVWVGPLEYNPDMYNTPLFLYARRGLDNLNQSERIQMYSADFGPTPDPHNPEATGSGRVHAHLCPAGLTLAEGVDSAAMRVSAQTWTRYQGRRGCNVDWNTLEQPDYFLGHGYGSSAGGFSNLYSSSMPPGMEGWHGTGAPPPNAQHMTIDALVWIALAYKSFAATHCAVGQYQAAASAMRRGEYWGNSRSFGWFFKATAYMAPLTTHTPVPYFDPLHVVNIADQALEKLEASNWMEAPVCDSGIHSEGGHLDNLAVRIAARDFFGVMITVDQARVYAKSCNSWMTGILIEGLVNWIELWDSYGWWKSDMEMRKRVMSQIKLASAWLVRMTSEAYNVTYGTKVEPPYGFHDDLAPYHHLCQGGQFANTAKGVYARFLVGPCFAVDRLFGDSTLSDACAPIIDECRESGWWGNGTDYPAWVAECGMEPVRKLGWDL